MDRKLGRLTIVALVLALSGCVEMPTTPQDDAKVNLYLQTIPVCSTDSDCKAKWEAAQLWVVHHAGYKIQVANDVLIETYNSMDGDPRAAAQVTKEPLGGGKYRLLIKVTCDNIFGCVPPAIDSMLDFNRTVSAVTP